jgi:hypothetical protein
VAAIWAALNGFLAALLFIFTARDDVQERAIYWSSVALVVLTSTFLLLAPRHTPRSVPVPGGGRSANGATAAALAGAALIGGYAWVFGVLIAYLALPLVAFVLARWRVEWAEARHRSRE